MVLTKHLDKAEALTHARQIMDKGCRTASSTATKQSRTAAVKAASKQRASLEHPPMDVGRYLDNLLRQVLAQTVKSLAGYSHMVTARRIGF